MRSSLTIMTMLLGIFTGCAGGGGGGGDDHQSADGRSTTEDFVLSVCMHPAWLEGYDEQRIDALASYAVDILEAPIEEDVDPEPVPENRFDLLSLMLHELLHVKGIEGADLPLGTPGIMAPVQALGEDGRQRVPTEADLALLASFEDIYRLEYAGITEACDVPMGFRDLEEGKLGGTFRSQEVIVVWFDTQPYHIPDVPDVPDDPDDPGVHCNNLVSDATYTRLWSRLWCGEVL